MTASEQCKVHGVAAFNEGIAFSDPKAHQIKHYSPSTGISVLAGDDEEGRSKGRAEFANFMQPTGLCSEFDCNLFVCDSQLGEISIVTGLQGTYEFLSVIGKLYRCFGVHKKHQVVTPLEVDKYEETLMSVAIYIKHSVDEVREVTENQKKSLNGPDGTVASKTVDSVQMIADGVLQLDGNLQAVNGEYKVNLESCMTEQVESLHATHHFKHDTGAHVLDYARSFGNTVKEGLKRTTIWSTYYFTNKKSYYPIPTNSLRFWDIPLLPPLPAVSMSDVHQDFMREWARDNGKSVRQRTVRQETTKYESGTLPLNMYRNEEQIGEKLQFDGESQEREEAIEGDKYSDESGNDPDSDLSDDELTRQNLSFLATNRSGRNISINKKYGV